MKGFVKKIMLVVPVLLMMLSVNFLPAQTPPSPPSHSEGGNQGKGGSATLEDGAEVVLALVAGYGAWLLYRRLNKKKETTGA